MYVIQLAITNSHTSAVNYTGTGTNISVPASSTIYLQFPADRCTWLVSNNVNSVSSKNTISGVQYNNGGTTPATITPTITNLSYTTNLGSIGKAGRFVEIS